MTGPALLLSVLGALPPDADVAVVRRHGRWLVGIHPEDVLTASGPAALAALDRLGDAWWAGFLTYDLGRSVERVTRRLPDDLGLPDLALARFDSRLVISSTGGRVEGHGTTRRFLEATLRRARRGAANPERGPLGLHRWTSSLDRAAYEAGVHAIIDLIDAGDCYQVNLTRRLHCETPADPVALFASLARHNPAPHAALLRLGGTAVVSASPERFLRRVGDGVETRPIKGTGLAGDALARSPKDRAENVMITDLARNDLGRVCRFGSVTVPALCAPEPHPGLWHLVSTVRGRLRDGVSTGDLVRATFPPASVTGAPKPRVLQAIEDLEPVVRGVYCGAVGWIDGATASLDLNVAIRTFLVTGSGTYLGVGGGIVADSDPAAEWAETELKAARLLAAAGSEALVAAP